MVPTEEELEQKVDEFIENAPGDRKEDFIHLLLTEYGELNCERCGDVIGTLDRSNHSRYYMDYCKGCGFLLQLKAFIDDGLFDG